MNKQMHSKKFYLLILPMLAALAITGCGKGCGKVGESGGETKVLKILPAGKNVLIGVDWKELQDSPLSSKFKENVPEQFKPVIKEIDQVTVAFTAQGMGKGPEDAVAVVSGSFDPDKLIAMMKEQAKTEGDELVESDYQGAKLYSSAKEQDVAATFIEKNLIIGKKTAVQQVIDLSRGNGESVEKDQNLMGLLNAVDTKRMLWAVAIVPEGAMGANSEQPGNPLGALAGVKALDLALDVSKDLTLDVGIIAGTPEDAKQMETMVNSYKTLFGASLAQQDPSLGKVLNNLNIAVDDKRVALNLKLDEATVTEISKKAGGSSTPMAVEEEAAESETVVEEAKHKH